MCAGDERAGAGGDGGMSRASVSGREAVSRDLSCDWSAFGLGPCRRRAVAFSRRCQEYRPSWGCLKLCSRHNEAAKKHLGFLGHSRRVSRGTYLEWAGAEVASVEALSHDWRRAGARVRKNGVCRSYFVCRRCGVRVRESCSPRSPFRALPRPPRPGVLSCWRDRDRGRSWRNVSCDLVIVRRVTEG